MELLGGIAALITIIGTGIAGVRWFRSRPTPKPLLRRDAPAGATVIPPARSETDDAEGTVPDAPEPSGGSGEDDLDPHAGSVRVFSWRMADAFPGLRGFTEIAGPVVAAERLQVLLRAPLSKRVAEESCYLFDPFWWFRGTSNLSITGFEVVAPGRCLLGPEELSLGRICGYRSGLKERDFVYVECVPDPPVGVYSYSDGEIDARLQERYESGYGAYVAEEYGLWQGRPITRAEYDDDATLVDGQPTRTHGAQLRVRYVTPYNFLVAGQASVINQKEFDRPLGALLDKILLEGLSLDALVTYIDQLPQNSEVREHAP